MDLKRQIGEDELRCCGSAEGFQSQETVLPKLFSTKPSWAEVVKNGVQNSLVPEPTGNHELGVEGTITNKEVDGFRSNGLHDEELVLGCKSPIPSILAQEGGNMTDFKVGYNQEADKEINSNSFPRSLSEGETEVSS
ncbi:hypothetical protein V6N13_000830 [Hibiscus sabdariffa]|uniref:Uncharacterized protein n=1 Tax=Hibiscus sabdariffa TaxID=183260 RepID=A0ABR2G6I2_9ROSI